MKSVTFIPWRFYLILAVISLIILGLIGRLFHLTILNQHFLRHQGDERVLRLSSTLAFRGIIVDRNGYPLAVSTTVYSIWMNPKEFITSKEAITQLSQLLNIKRADILSRSKKKKEFVYLKRSVAPELANQIKVLQIPGVYLQKEYKRYYPEGEATGHITGFTNVDDQGQEGLELFYNDWLKGVPGQKWVVKDRLGRTIEDVQKVQDEKRGHDLVLSIDRRIQYLAYRALLEGVQANQAKSGTAIVLDTNTGEVLAMVNQPSFNPNNRIGGKSEQFRNRAITDTFEPGSTIKAFTIASALDSGKYKPDTLIDTYPGWMRVGHHLAKDHQNNGVITVTQVLQKSSNVGATKIVLDLPPDQLWSLLHRVGLGEITGIGFPGEQNGVLIKHNPWGAIMLATLSFGYGVSASALQLTRAYSVFANEGMKLPVSLLKLDKPPAGERVIDAKIAKQMMVLLESVLNKGGTAVGVHVPGYRVAGKTGTAWKVGSKGYDKHRYTSSFIAMAPASKPRLVVAVIIHDPQGKKYYGGDVSGPVFEKIMSGALRILNVAPDAEVSI